MAVSVYPGIERDGLERRAGAFKDGIFMMKCEIERRQIVVTNPQNQEFYRSEPIGALDNYAVQSIACLRSAQTGRLVVILGGFYAGSSKQQALTLATDYAISEEIRFEEYQEGKR